MGRGKFKPRKVFGGGIFSRSDLNICNGKKFWVRAPASRGKGGRVTKARSQGVSADYSAIGQPYSVVTSSLATSSLLIIGQCSAGSCPIDSCLAWHSSADIGCSAASCI